MPVLVRVLSKKVSKVHIGGGNKLQLFLFILSLGRHVIDADILVIFIGFEAFYH